MKIKGLTDKQIAEIRRKYKPYQKGIKELAKEYGVTEYAITKAVTNWRWEK